ncbi:hypothetical protein EDB19DRAFT_1822268 [Suillus lakei]|nr:hypothetical protein EDB19DRAFT_1822268 [Suillus lakei]
MSPLAAVGLFLVFIWLRGCCTDDYALAAYRRLRTSRVQRSLCKGSKIGALNIMNVVLAYFKMLQCVQKVIESALSETRTEILNIHRPPMIRVTMQTSSGIFSSCIGFSS